MPHDILAIETVVDVHTPEALACRPDRRAFYSKMRVPAAGIVEGFPLETMLEQMDAAGTERAMLIAAKVRPGTTRPAITCPMRSCATRYAATRIASTGSPGSIRPRAWMACANSNAQCAKTDSSARTSIRTGTSSRPTARWYPFYAKCVELDVPVQLQVGQSMIYDPSLRLRSVGRPIALDAVACDFPELKLIGIHVGIPWTDEMIAMAWKHPNVFIGCDAHSPAYWPESFRHYINSYGQDKVLFGTDFPILGFERTRAEIEALDLKPGVLRKLLRDNAKPGLPARARPVAGDGEGP